MRILVTGSSGMLGRVVCQELFAQYEVVGMDMVAPPTEHFLHTFIECDITEQGFAVEKLCSIHPDVVIHTAAYTDVDGCEKDPGKADRVNAQGTETLARATQMCKALFCYISTDFVFDGEKKTAYTETDAPHPINAYGRAKWAGEQAVQSLLTDFMIIRSSWLFGRGGRNFVDTLLKRAGNEKEIPVVAEQFGAPTYVNDLAQGIKKLVELNSQGENPRGIYHITNSGSCSWHEFAEAIIAAAGLGTRVLPITAEEYFSRTRRPRMSVLENMRYQQYAKEKMRHWKDALGEYLYSRWA